MASSNLASKYDPPVVWWRTTIGPRYLGFVFQFNFFLIQVFQTRTRLPGLKSKSLIWFLNCISNCWRDTNWNNRTHLQIVSISSQCFWSCWTLQAIREDLEIESESGTGIRNVAFARSKGKSDSMPCIMKYSKSPVDLRIVICSAQNTEWVVTGQQTSSPRELLTLASQIS